MAVLAVAAGLPLAIGLVIAYAGERSVRVTQVLALLGPLGSLVAGVQLVGLVREGGWMDLTGATWTAAPDTGVLFGFAGDALGGLMLIIVGVVAACVVAFSWGYMAHEEGRPRYFAVLMLFVAAMSILTLADNLVTLFIGWELVGACSYLLIGFWYRKPAATRAAVKAFMTTRVGDVAMLAGMAVLWSRTDTLAFRGIFESIPTMPAGAVTAAALLILAGAAGKSAQFPLHIWLPDAMEGPTPVSALIHAATMVAAGVFLVSRTWPLFAASDVARTIMLTIGVLTALYAAVVALAQTDLKKMLAYSTISQLGFMFAALGASAWGAAMFHLTTHAAFKALLFLAAGSVIHGSQTQDMREMGGLARSMPITAACWASGALALSGWWPFAGFFSKDAIVAAVDRVSPLGSVLLLVTSALTALYIWRATIYAFLGEPRSDTHAHESRGAMIVPMAVLAAGALGLGWTGGALRELLGSQEAHAGAVTIATAVVAVVLGTAAAVAWSARRVRIGGAFANGRAWEALRGGLGVDAGIQAITVRPVLAYARWVDSIGDRRIVDRMAEGLGGAAVVIGGAFARLQTGETDVYASFVAVGFVVLSAIVLWAGGR